jgi:hypothetical protein
MASEKQIVANRANATRSTGPKTAAGKLKSSRNAYRHGLSGEFPLDPIASAKVDALARAVVGGEASMDRLTSAADFARAQLELLRVRALRIEMIKKIKLDDVNQRELRRVAALDRYERYCSTKRRRAAQKL